MHRRIKYIGQPDILKLHEFSSDYFKTLDQAPAYLTRGLLPHTPTYESRASVIYLQSHMVTPENNYIKRFH